MVLIPLCKAYAEIFHELAGHIVDTAFNLIAMDLNG